MPQKPKQKSLADQAPHHKTKINVENTKAKEHDWNHKPNPGNPFSTNKSKVELKINDYTSNFHHHQFIILQI